MVSLFDSCVVVSVFAPCCEMSGVEVVPPFQLATFVGGQGACVTYRKDGKSQRLGRVLPVFLSAFRCHVDHWERGYEQMPTTLGTSQILHYRGFAS